MARTEKLIRWTKKKQSSANASQIQIKQGKLLVYGKLSIIYERTIVTNSFVAMIFTAESVLY